MRIFELDNMRFGNTIYIFIDKTDCKKRWGIIHPFNNVKDNQVEKISPLFKNVNIGKAIKSKPYSYKKRGLSLKPLSFEAYQLISKDLKKHKYQYNKKRGLCECIN